MKPVQCGGEDAQFLKRSLQLKTPLKKINPCFAEEPLSPHLAFARQKTTVDIPKILEAYRELQQEYDLLLIEGAGGLLVPLREDYSVADLIREMELEVIIVARLGLGTINHTLLTINQARAMGLNVKGVIFNTTSVGKLGIPERTNAEIIGRLGQVPVLGVMPRLEKLEVEEIRKSCASAFDFNLILQTQASTRWVDLKARDKKYLWHPFTQMKDWLNEEPLVIDEARGCYLKDVNGRRYLDGVSSLWVNVHGHRKKEIDEAIKAQVNRLSHSTLLGLSNAPAVELAEALVKIAPKGLAKVFYSDNGSTAVEVAVKIAYQFWQNIGRTRKSEIAHLSNAYHGDTLGSVSVGGIDLFHKVYRNLIFKTLQVEFPDFYRCPKGKSYPAYTEECLRGLEDLFEEKHDSIAAFVVEPIVQGAAGMIVWPEGIFKKISLLCKKHDIFLIADEVATGFGRTGRMFACEHEEVTPDILCLAKGLTGGYLPLAATLTTKRIFEGFLFDYKEQKTFFHGHTYTGNPLACAAALANLKIFEEERTLDKLQSKIKYLAAGLKKFYNLSSVGDIRQKGMMVGIELVKDKKTKEPYPWEERMGVKVCQEVRKHGVILRPLGNVIVLMPPLAITKEEIDQLLEATYRSIEKVT